MLPCKGCAYREGIPGGAHSRCVFDWVNKTPDKFVALIESAKLTPRTAQWFRFPFNYDPTWGPDLCPNFAETRDPAMVAPPSPLADILSLLR
jgi:hypothetical protein